MSLLAGLTGGIGSGKSLAAEMFRKKSARVISADAIARDLVRPEEPAWKEIVRFFGGGIVLENGDIDRTVLGKIVFDDSEKRKTLESILHPAIIDEEMKIYRAMASEDPRALVILEAALLIESGNHKNMDQVIVVSCGEEERIRRLIKRDGLLRSDIEKRLNAQMKLNDKIRFADHILRNDGTKEELERQVDILYEKLKAQV